jgi:predicted RNA-binding Zn-ribbon protein involved in translation (DUF1610 family)
MLESNDPWAAYRTRRRLFYFAVLGYLPGVVVIGVILNHLFNSEYPVSAVAIAWMIFCGVSTRRFLAVRCPRCGKPFVQRSSFSNVFARKCVNCGLPKGWVSEGGG